MPISKAILSKIVYFDIFDYPLTAQEIHRNLFLAAACGESPSFLELRSALNKLNRYVECDNGFYFLRGRGSIVRLRLTRQAFAIKKLQRAKWFAKLLALMPFVHGIAISNNLAYQNVSERSDIDFFIIVSLGRVWTARFFINTLARIFCFKPIFYNKKNKLCVNFIVDENHINIEEFMLPEAGSVPDIHYIYWVSQFMPIFGKNVFEKFADQNRWFRNYLPNAVFGHASASIAVKLGWFGRAFKRFLEKRALSEELYKKVQIKIMPLEIRGMMNKDTRVAIGNGVLKLHTNDRREIYRRKFIDAIDAIEKFN